MTLIQRMVDRGRRRRSAHRHLRPSARAASGRRARDGRLLGGAVGLLALLVAAPTLGTNRSQLPVSPTTAGAVEGGAAIVAEGTVTIPVFACYDIDRERQLDEGDWHCDVGYLAGQSEEDDAITGRLEVVGRAEPSVAECDSLLKLRKSRIPVSSVLPGTWLCLDTNHHSGSMRILDVAGPGGAYKMTFSYQLWEWATCGEGCGEDPDPEPDPPVVAEGLTSTLLQPSDLPTNLESPDGPQPEAEFDLDWDAFAANGGIAVASQVWQDAEGWAGGPGTVFMLFDFRMAFPTPEAAAAYLAEAEDVLSERGASGTRLVPDSLPVGEDHRLYRGTASVDGLDIGFLVHLFRVGPVAAKVFATTHPTGGGPAARGAAALAASRITAAVDGGTSIDRSLDPPTVASGEAMLRERLKVWVDDCQGDPARSFEGELAAIVCPVLDDASISLRLLDSPETLASAFKPYVTGLEEGDPGACAQGSALEPSIAEGEVVGRLACFIDGERRYLMWTDERTNVLAYLWSDSLDWGPLYAISRIVGSSTRPAGT